MQKNKKQKIALVAAVVILAGIVAFGAYNTEDFQGALKNKSKSTKSSSTSSTSSSMSVATTTGQSTCSSDEMQSFTMQADGSAEYNKRYIEHTFNELYDNAAFTNVVKAALEATLPNLDSVTSVVTESDHPNYFDNGETGSLTVEYKYNNSSQYPVHAGKFVQKVAVTAQDEGVPVSATIELTDGTKFRMRVYLTPTLNYTIYTPLTGSGYTLGSGTVVGGWESQGGAYGKNIQPTSSSIKLTSFSGSFGDSATVSRVMPDGNEVSDPILQDVVRTVLSNNPISISTSSTGFSGVQSALATMTDAHSTLASIAGWNSAKQSVTDGISSSYVPVMAYSQDSKVKMHACASASDFDSSTLTLPRVIGGTTYAN